LIPATVVMLSCRDSRTSRTLSTDSFTLPANAGPGGAGGACTTSLVQALSESDEHTWFSLLGRMRQILAGRYPHIPMFSSSQALDLRSPFRLTSAASGGRFRALLIGINYAGSQSPLRGCHKDVEMMRQYLNNHGHSDGDMRVLLDNGVNEEPNKAGIVMGLQWLADSAGRGDSLFLHYSGHGASVHEGNEEDSRDEALCPLDYESVGLIRDDEFFRYLVAPLQQGACLTCVIDCCHGGTMLDLPYLVKAPEHDGAGEVMQANADFDFGKLLQVLKDDPSLPAAAAGMTGAAFFSAGPEKRGFLARTPA